jgi:hypothetical protein
VDPGRTVGRRGTARATQPGAVAHWLPGRRPPGHARPRRWRSSGPGPHEARRARSPWRVRPVPGDVPRRRAGARRPQTRRRAHRAAARRHPPTRASRREALRPGPRRLAGNLRCDTTTPQRHVPLLRCRRVPRSLRRAPCGRCRPIAATGPPGRAPRCACERRRPRSAAICRIAARPRAGPVRPRPPPPRRRRRSDASKWAGGRSNPMIGAGRRAVCLRRRTGSAMPRTFT